MKQAPSAAAQVQITKDGPYVVAGNLPLSKQSIGTNRDGESVRWEQREQLSHEPNYALCRCGHSGSKPFCDGTHAKIGFDGREAASRQPYREQATITKGPAMSLTDAENLCAFARFCDAHGQIWNLVKETDRDQAREYFIGEAGNCPSGRLVAWDNESGEPVEPDLEPSIVLIVDPAQDCSGPIWLRGGVPLLSSDGFHYERRNRVTLCRCGASQNKPFCDGAHASIKFQDT